jgi:hypothetical protein
MQLNFSLSGYALRSSDIGFFTFLRVLTLSGALVRLWSYREKTGITAIMGGEKHASALKHLP